MTTPPFDPPTPRDIEVVSAQLGRPARGVVGIAHRSRGAHVDRDDPLELAFVVRAQRRFVGRRRLRAGREPCEQESGGEGNDAAVSARWAGAV